MRRQREVFAEAAAKAELIQNCSLDVESTLQLMTASQTTWTGLQKLKTLLKHKGVYLGIASEAKVKKHIATFDVNTVYHTVKLQVAVRSG